MFEPVTIVSQDEAVRSLLLCLHRLATEGGPLVATCLEHLPDRRLKFTLWAAKTRLCAFAADLDLDPEAPTKIEVYNQADAQEILRDYFGQSQ